MNWLMNAVARQVEDPRVRLPLQHLLADGLEQVRLAEPDAAVDEQRVVRLPGLLGDGDATPRAAGGCRGR